MIIIPPPPVPALVIIWEGRDGVPSRRMGGGTKFSSPIFPSENGDRRP